MEKKFTLELGYSFPVETSLRVPNVRRADEIWREMFIAAAEAIDVEQLYIASPGGTVIDEYLLLIREVARRHAIVRFIFDRNFFDRNLSQNNCDYIRPVEELESIAGVHVRFVSIEALTGGAQHAKYFIIDKRMAWLGSHNFDWRSFEHIFEVGVRINHPILALDLASIFEIDWSSGTSIEGRQHFSAERAERWVEIDYYDETHLAKILASPGQLSPSTSSLQLDYTLDEIIGARESISIQLRNFSINSRNAPAQEWKLLYFALANAANRGVRVRLLVDGQRTKDVRQRELLNELNARLNIQVRTLNVPESTVGAIPFARMLHAKLLVVDSASSWIGTGNWTPDDFLCSRNTGIAVKGHKFARDLSSIFDTCWNSPYSTASI